MTHGTFYSHDLKCIVQQVTKPTARKMYESGKIVYLHSSNMTFDNMWQHPMPAKRDGYSLSDTLLTKCAALMKHTIATTKEVDIFISLFASRNQPNNQQISQPL